MAISQEEFNKMRKFAAGGLESLADELDSLALHDAAEEMRNLAKDTADGSFKIIVMGDFSAGKSTILNAMMGQSLLPTDMTPTTAVITRLIYGPTPQVVIKHLNARTPDRIMSLDAFREEVKLAAQDSKNVDTDRWSDIKEAVVHYPLEILRHNVEIIDSPGLNDSPVRTKRTLEMLDSMDAVVFLLIADQFFTEIEQTYLENYLLPRGLKNIFFVINRWDLIDVMSTNPEKQRKDIQELAIRKLNPYCTVDGANLYNQRVFPVSSLQAVKGREKGDPALLDQSGFPLFENSLNQFLVEDRGRVIFKRIIDRVKLLQQDRVQSVIDNIMATLGTTVEELEGRLTDLSPNLERLQKIKESILERVSLKSKQAENMIFDSYVEKMRQIQNDVLPGEVENFDFSEIGFLDRLKSSGKQQIQVIFEKESAKVMQRELSNWSNQVGTDMNKTFEELMADIDDYSIQYQKEVEEIMGRFRGDSLIMTKPDVLRPNWAATALGVLCLDPAVAMGGYNNGWAGAAANLGLSLGVSFLTSWLLGPIGPIAWLGYQAWRVFDITKPEKLANQLVNSVRSERLLENKAREDEQKLKMGITQSFNDIAFAVESAIDSDIKDLQASMQEIINQKRAEERSAVEEKARLEGIQQRFAKTVQDMEQKLLDVESVA